MEAGGFKAPRGADTIWWRTFLGEQHYYNPGKAPVDLHHRIQQPGCPSPRSLTKFWKSSVCVSVGKLPVSSLSPLHACLLSCMNLVKALSTREAAGAHAWDLATYLAACSPDDVRVLSAAARDVGLLNTLRLGLRIVGALFGVRVVGVEYDHTLASVSDVQLVSLILDPHAENAVGVRRAKLLVGLSDNSLDLTTNILCQI